MSQYIELIDQAMNGSQLATGKLARIIDDDLEGKGEILRELYPKSGSAHIVGITGPPGAGKSTLTSCLIGSAREDGRKVAVLAVDPTSPFSGGAVLGDRIRMQKHAADPEVFIRSLATRGHSGGLSASVQTLTVLLDAVGYDLILVETVGVGQEEVEIKDLSHTTVFVTVPGLGDGIQAMKAGVLEIANIYLVNKADLSHADLTVKDLQTMLNMTNESPAWEPPVLTSVAKEDKGISDLMDAVKRHRQYLEESGELDSWIIFSAENSIRLAINDMVKNGIRGTMDNFSGELAEDVKRVARRLEDPMSVARRWITKLDLSGD